MYPNLLCSGALGFWIHRHFLLFVTCGKIHFIWMHRISGICAQAIMRWLFVIVTTHCTHQILGRASSVGCTAEDMACLCCLASVPNCPFLAVFERLSIRMVSTCLWSSLMGSRYPTMVHLLLFRTVHWVTCILLSASIPWCVIGTLKFVCVDIPAEYAQTGKTSNYSPSQRWIVPVITSKLWAGNNIWRGLVYLAFQRVPSLHTTSATS